VPLEADTVPVQNIRDHEFREVARDDDGNVAEWKLALDKQGIAPLDSDTVPIQNVRGHKFREAARDDDGTELAWGSALDRAGIRPVALDTAPTANVHDYAFRDAALDGQGDELLWRCALDRAGTVAVVSDTEVIQNITKHSFRDAARDANGHEPTWQRGLDGKTTSSLAPDTDRTANVRDHTFREPARDDDGQQIEWKLNSPSQGFTPMAADTERLPQTARDHQFRDTTWKENEAPSGYGDWKLSLGQSRRFEATAYDSEPMQNGRDHGFRGDDAETASFAPWRVGLVAPGSTPIELDTTVGPHLNEHAFRDEDAMPRFVRSAKTDKPIDPLPLGKVHIAKSTFPQFRTLTPYIIPHSCAAIDRVPENTLKRHSFRSEK
jgi:hypothetical protein